MTSTPSPQGRRIIVAEVNGDAGRAIQAWREVHDPREALRLPPHATLCYWAPDAPIEEIEQQVRYAFPEALDIRLGGVMQGDNDQGTLFVEIIDEQPLDAGVQRLYDGTHVKFPPRDGWQWHVTCVRDTRGRDAEALLEAAASLRFETPWLFDTVSYLVLDGERYRPLATWRLGPLRAAPG
jgi:hypothetical protein